MTAETRLSILVNVNHQAAVPALGAVKGAVDAIGTAAATTGRGIGAVAPAVTAAGQAGQAGMTAIAQAAAATAPQVQASARSFDDLRMALDPAYANTVRYRDIQAELAGMLERGEATQRQVNLALEQAASRYMGVATAAERRIQAERELEAAESRALMTRALAQQGYDALRASVDPVYAASMRYEQALQTLDAAQAAGVISDRDRLRTLALLDAQMIDTAGAAQRAAAVQDQHARTYETLRASVDSVYATSRRYEAAVEALNAAQAAGVISDRDRLRTLEMLEAQMIQTAAAGRGAGDMANATNLGYQANDIMMMAALGQSPMALTLQQGPQVVQILNKMRASGQAVGPAILGSITSLINPMSLLTLGLIAGGAALFQWGMSALGAGEEAVTLEDRIEGLNDASDRVRQSLDRLRDENPAETFGNLTAEVMTLSEALLALDRAAQVDNLRATLDQLLSSAADPTFMQRLGLALAPAGAQMSGQGMAGLADLEDQVREGNWAARTGGQGLTFQDFDQRRDLIDQLALAGDIEAVTREITRLFTDMAGDGPITAMNGDLRSMLTTLADIAISTAETEAYFNGSADAARTANQHTNELRAAVEAEAEARRAAAQAAVDAAQADRDRAADLLADLDREAALRDAIARYGDDSLAVARLRAAQERDVYEAMVDALQVSGEMKAEIMASWDAANGVVDAGMADAIGAAVGVAGTLSANLWAAAGGAWSAARGMAAAAAAQVQAMRPVTLSPEAQADRRDSMEGRLDDVSVRPDQPMVIPPAVSPPSRPMDIDWGVVVPEIAGGGAAGGSGGTSAIGATREDVAALIAELQAERDVLRELDPVQQELLRHREVLAVATAGERAQIEGLITTRLAEAAAQEEVQRRMEATRDLGRDVIGSIVSDLREGASAGEALANVFDKIADKLLDLGTDRLTDALFGTGQAGAGSGLFGALFGAMFGGAGSAGSGRVTPHALGAVYDSPLYFAMDGGLGLMAEAGPEAIMPLTHQFGAGVGAVVGGRETTLPLARLASGKLGVDLGAVTSPFAMGGAFGDLPMASAPPSWRQAIAAAPSAAPAAPAVIQLTPTIVNNTGRAVAVETEEYTDSRGQRQQRYVLSDMAGEGLAVRGGKASKVLGGMGVRPQARGRGG